MCCVCFSGVGIERSVRSLALTARASLQGCFWEQHRVYADQLYHIDELLADLLVNVEFVAKQKPILLDLPQDERENIITLTSLEGVARFVRRANHGRGQLIQLSAPISGILVVESRELRHDLFATVTDPGDLIVTAISPSTNE